MSELRISFVITAPAYRVPALQIHGQKVEVQVDLEDGTHTFTSDDFDLGIIHSLGAQVLVGRLSFRYTFDSVAQVVTICGTDYASADGMTLASMPRDTDHICLQHAAASGFTDDELPVGRIWNYNTQLMPGAGRIFKDLVRDANESLIRTLQATNGITTQVRRTLSKLPLEHYLDLCVVYRNNQFLEIYNASRQYEPGDQVKSIDSSFNGIVYLDPGENFANVIGSTDDPKIASLSWIRLWAGEMGFYPTVCTSLNYKGFPCDSDLKGGHILLGKTAKVVAAGSKKVQVYIVPICTNHNNNDHVYMAAITYLQGVWLKDYLE